MVDKEIKKRFELLKPVKAEILNQIDYYIRSALTDTYLARESIKQIENLVTRLTNGNVKMDAINFEVRKRKNGKELILYCPFDIEVHINKFMFERMVEEWGDLNESFNCNSR
jgi:hypothetical protein